MDISGTSIHAFLLQSAQEKLELCNKKLSPINKPVKGRKKSKKKEPLLHHMNDHITYEAGIDEAGRGPMFGRVYSACVILPHNDETFDYSCLKDSKRFSSHKKLMSVYEYIKENAVDYCVCYEDEATIDNINILQATQQCMHSTIKGLTHRPEHLLVDGNYFKIYKDKKGVIPFTCVESGDNTYCAIAAASILAKVERDKYIEELCKENPELDTHYGLLSNKGYGTKKHIDGIKEHGISEWHRKTFGICKKFA